MHICTHTIHTPQYIHVRIKSLVCERMRMHVRSFKYYIIQVNYNRSSQKKIKNLALYIFFS